MEVNMKKNKEEKEELETKDNETKEHKETSEKKELKAKLKEYKKKLEEGEEKQEELKDLYQRLAAEFDNYKRRTQKEKEAIYVDSVADTIKAILPIIDNFERALATDTENAQSIQDGMEMIYRQLKDAIKKQGIEEIPSVGEKFDPTLHNAVMHSEDEEQDENVVVEEFQKGYKIKDKVIRHSMVKVVN